MLGTFIRDCNVLNVNPFVRPLTSTLKYSYNWRQAHAVTPVLQEGQKSEPLFFPDQSLGHSLMPFTSSSGGSLEIRIRRDDRL